MFLCSPDLHKKKFSIEEMYKIISKWKSEEKVIILYTIVDNNLASYLKSECDKANIPCYEALGGLISDFSKLLKQEASHKPSAQHALDEEYYKRIEAVQFTMTHDDGKIISDINKSDIVLRGSARVFRSQRGCCEECVRCWRARIRYMVI